MDGFKPPNGYRTDEMPAKKLTEQELERHKENHKIYVRQDTPAGEAWAAWAREKLGKSQVWDANGGWWMASELPPQSPGES